jgi:DNA modification methylase
MVGHLNKVLIGDVIEQLKTLDDNLVDCVVTSPPYWGLRDYGVEGQLGLEKSPQEFIDNMVNVFREVRRVLKDDGTLWLNIGDSYSGSGKGPAGNLGKKHNERHLEHKTGGLVPEGTKPKDLVGIPWMLAFALRADGWYLRQDIIWAKPNVMPESVRDRCTKSHEYIFLLTKSPRYYYDHEAIKEPVSEVSLKRAQSGWKSNRPSTKTSAGRIDVVEMGTRFVNPSGRNKRSVWFVPTASFKGAHFATFPTRLIEPCVLAGSRPGGIVLDPFFGSGTTGVVALQHNRKYIGIELNPEYAAIAEKRLQEAGGLFK